MTTSQALPGDDAPLAPAAARSKTAEAKRSLSLADAATLALIAVVVVLVSLPRLRRFALRENETDAIRMLRVLAVDAAEKREVLDAGGLSALLAASTEHRVRLEDVEVLEEGRLRRHGYVFESAVAADGRPVLLAWPWEHGRTGLAVFAVEPGGPVLGLANADGRISGPGSPPPLPPREPRAPWRELPEG